MSTQDRGAWMYAQQTPPGTGTARRKLASAPAPRNRKPLASALQTRAHSVRPCQQSAAQGGREASPSIEKSLDIIGAATLTATPRRFSRSSAAGQAVPRAGHGPCGTIMCRAVFRSRSRIGGRTGSVMAHLSARRAANGKGRARRHDNAGHGRSLPGAPRPVLGFQSTLAGLPACGLPKQRLRGAARLPGPNWGQWHWARAPVTVAGAAAIRGRAPLAFPFHLSGDRHQRAPLMPPREPPVNPALNLAVQPAIAPLRPTDPRRRWALSATVKTG